MEKNFSVPTQLFWRCRNNVAPDSFGLNRTCQFFVKNYCLWHKHLENEIIWGSKCLIFQKWGPNIAILDLVN